MLHTTHTAQRIPEIVKEAPGFMALQRYDWLAEFRNHERMPKSREELLDFMSGNCVGDGHDYQIEVAAWLIACRPGMLRVVPKEYRRDLPSWSGIDHPYLLTLSEHNWRLTRGGLKKPIEFDPIEKSFDALWNLCEKVRSESQH